MRKWLFIFLFLCFNIQLSFAQNNLIEVETSASGLFIDHKVAAKESLYSLGRLYNVSPKELATFNKVSLTTGLNIGQDLKIPLGKDNFTQTEIVSADEVLVPVHHTLQSHETLFRLSQNFHKVPVDQLKKWNHLQSDAISTGAPLIIGFLKVDKNQSALASQKFVPEIVAQEKLQQIEPAKIKQADVAPVVIQKEIVPVTEKERKGELKVAPVIQKEIVAVAEKDKKQEPILPITKEAEEKMPITELVNQPKIDFAGGAFKVAYERQNIQNPELDSATAMGSIFKSTSGWQDGKYYCFNNESAPGSILRIMNKESGKIIYAKVLDVIPDIKQNAGLQIIISNAAAEELGVGEKFECAISR